MYKTDAALPVVCLDTNFKKDDKVETDAFSKALDTIFVTAKMMSPYDPTPAMAHRAKIDEAEAERIKQSKDLVKAQKYILELEKKAEEALRKGDDKTIEKLQELFMENLNKMSEQNREQMRLVAEAHERQRKMHEEAMNALIEQSNKAREDAERRI
jgi:hypothetical protein